MLLSDMPAIAGQLAQAKASMEAQELRDQIGQLTAQLDRTRKNLKAERARCKRLRRRLDQINPTKEEHHAND